MGVTVTEHEGRIEIVQKPAIAPGTMGWTAMLMAICLIALCVFIVVLAVVFVGQLGTDAVPAAEFWIAMPLMAVGTLSFAFFALWEISNALPRRIEVTPLAIAVKFATPVPFGFDIGRKSGVALQASVHYRMHRNYAQAPTSGRYMTIRSLKPYVVCGGRSIGPMDDEDAKALRDALNRALSNTKSR